MSFQAGDKVGEYQVTGHLGMGGMGQIYQVRNLITDRLDALKVLVSDLEANAQLGERFLREIKVQASLSHPNIASLHTAFRHGNQLLAVMEFVNGLTLDAKLAGSATIRDVAGWTTQLLAALDYAHQRGVVHRDIKPSNVMITAQGVVKLLDFGIASSDASQAFRLTATGAPIGTVYYMSPEQIRSGSVDGRSDVYSTGILLYEACTGRRPVEGVSAYECMKAHLELMPPRPEQVYPQLPPRLAAIIWKAIQKNPADRFQTANEFRMALLGGGSEPATATIHSVPPSPEVAPAATASPSTPLPSGWDPAVVEQARADLATFVGPMAKVLVKRALPNATSAQHLYETLSKEIEGEVDRKKFLALLRKR